MCNINVSDFVIQLNIVLYEQVRLAVSFYFYIVINRNNYEL